MVEKSEASLIPSDDLLTRVPACFRPLVQVLIGRSDLPERLARMALVFSGRASRADCKLIATLARELAPENFRVKVFTQWLDRHQAPLWHFSIIEDEERNKVYAAALERFVRPGMTVFEIGTGTGILAMLAAKAGAGHVYTCERRREVAAVAREIIEKNGLADLITVISKNAYDVRLGEDLPERADLFVAEIVDNSLLGELVLPLTELARRKFLTPDAILLPREVSAMGYLIAKGEHSSTWRMGQVMGFDLTPFNRFTPLEVSTYKGGVSPYKGKVKADPLSAPVMLLQLDLRVKHSAEATHKVRMVVQKEGVADGIMRWLRLDFGDGIVFENCPPRISCWDPQIHLLPKSIMVSAGDVVEFEVYRNHETLMILPLDSTSA